MRVQGGDPRAMTSVVREQLGEIDPNIAGGGCALDGDVLSRAAGAAAILTLLLSLFFRCRAGRSRPVGIYGVVSYSVARATKEFWITHGCLAAQGGDRVGLVMNQGAGNDF